MTSEQWLESLCSKTRTLPLEAAPKAAPRVVTRTEAREEAEKTALGEARALLDRGVPLAQVLQGARVTLEDLCRWRERGDMPPEGRLRARKDPKRSASRVLELGGSVRQAALWAGVSPSTVMRWKREVPQSCG